jgi:ABC-type Fe3+/spermidine/putrescine transport system ATPase subunit
MRSDTAGTLHVEGLTKRFGRHAAVEAVDLDLPAGEFFGLLGPSGCGKTTLLRMIAGLERPDSGRITVDGADITDEPPERRPFNMVFQRYALFPHLTVAANVAYGLTTGRSERLRRAEADRRVDQVLALVGLEGFRDRLPRQLSGGQQQRVAVARALVRRPRVLLLDEPMAALDRNVRHQVREEILRLHRETGTTFLMVTHDQEEALSISQRVALMNEGRFEQVATPQDLYGSPATLFAARFVGVGSFVAGTVLSRAGGRVEVDAGGTRFSALDATGDAGATRVEVLLRPRELVLTTDGPGRVAGHVLSSSFFGDHFEVVVRGDAGVLRVRHPSAVAPGTAVRVGWPPAAGAAYPSSARGRDAVVPDDTAAPPGRPPTLQVP